MSGGGQEMRTRLRAAMSTAGSGRPSATAQRSRDEMMALAAALHALAEVTDARGEICAIIARVMHAERVVLFEPDSDGLSSTASSVVGEEPQHYRWSDRSSAVLGFRTQRRVMIPELSLEAADSAHSDDLRRHLSELGITSALTEPVVSGGKTTAVLSIQFRARHERIGPDQTPVLEALASGAASAIARVDLVTRLAASAATDPLTGLANRRSWQRHVGEAIAAAERDEQQRLTIALIDIDHFKVYNDQHGHQAGDRLLIAFATMLTRVIRESDLLSRWGGDEFAMLLPASGLEAGAVIARRIARVLPAGVTCSVGLAQRSPGENDHDWLGRADVALRAAKAAGRARAYAAAAEPAALPVHVRDVPEGDGQVISLADHQPRGDRRRSADRRRLAERRRD